MEDGADSRATKFCCTSLYVQSVSESVVYCLEVGDFLCLQPAPATPQKRRENTIMMSESQANDPG
jgi:hypothetical protein